MAVVCVQRGNSFPQQPIQMMQVRRSQLSLIWSTILVCSGFSTMSAARAAPGALRPSDLRCEYARNPVGVNALRPQLSWALESRERNQRQSRYQVLVATTPPLLELGKG